MFVLWGKMTQRDIKKLKPLHLPVKLPAQRNPFMSFKMLVLSICTKKAAHLKFQFMLFHSLTICILYFYYLLSKSITTKIINIILKVNAYIIGYWQLCCNINNVKKICYHLFALTDLLVRIIFYVTVIKKIHKTCR